MLTIHNNFYKKLICCSLLVGAAFFVTAQTPALFFKDATKAKRDTFYNRTVRSINSTFLLPLNEANEEKWQAVFYNINLLNYKNAKVEAVIKNISTKIDQQSDDSKMAFLNLINNQYPKAFFKSVQLICNSTNNDKLQAMCLHYLTNSFKTNEEKEWINGKFKKILSANDSSVIVAQLEEEIYLTFNKNKQPNLSTFFDKNYLPNTTIVFSFQRKNRDYPGLAMIRKADGTFLKNKDGTYFAVGQLARSLSNMPGYISNGNTPQGIFTMHGFDTSKNYFIGPTTNIQLTMPCEKMEEGISTLPPDTICTLEQYKNLLPENCRNYAPLFGSFYSGKAGRTEIIAHGTTVNPNYYKGQKYFLYTPTAGCLATIELWNETNGALQTSNQYILTQALQKAGGAKGFLIVIEIDENSNEGYNPNKALTLQDLKKYLQK